MKCDERGSEVIQFAVATPLLLFVLFAVVQIAGMMLTTSQVSSEITRACRQLDVAGLHQAFDKEAFVQAELLGAATQLIPSNLHVSSVQARDNQDRLECGAQGGGTVEQRTASTELSFEVRYDIPSLLDMPGLAGQSLARQVAATYVGSRVIEVSMEELP